jgi:hypothetical protein
VIDAPFDMSLLIDRTGIPESDWRGYRQAWNRDVYQFQLWNGRRIELDGMQMERWRREKETTS